MEFVVQHRFATDADYFHTRIGERIHVIPPRLGRIDC